MSVFRLPLIAGVVLAALVVVAVPVTRLADEAVAVASPSGAVLFDSDRGLYVANLDGSSLKRFTKGAYDGNSVWAPDAKRIAFHRIRDDRIDVIVMKADGSGAHRIGGGVAPAWSPDGKRIAFKDGPGVVDASSGNELVPGPAGITVVNADGSGAKRIPAGEVFDFAWSPDGHGVAYTGRKDNVIRYVDASTGRTTPLGEVANAYALAWSPDGGRLVVEGNGLRLLDVAMRRVTRLTTNDDLGKRDDREPVWSPDGARIAFVRRHGPVYGPHELRVIGANGRGEHRLDTSPDGCLWVVSWTGDGRTLVYDKKRSRSDRCDIWRIGADGRGAARVTRGSGTDPSYYGPQWAATRIPRQPHARR